MVADPAAPPMTLYAYAYAKDVRVRKGFVRE
jgi:hypothetical protein